MKRTWARLVFLFVILLTVPVLADAGTPLMWAGILHLYFGNALIGIGEGILITKVFRLKPGCDILLLFILANYVSMAVGMAVARPHGIGERADLYGAPLVIALACAAFFAVTVLIEWPFVRLAFGRAQRAFRRSFLASLLAQTASYLVIVPWYSLASGVSLYTQATIDRDYPRWADREAMIYFIGETDGAVYRQRLSETAREEVLPSGSAGEDVHLLVRRSSTDAQWDLYLAEDRDGEDPRETSIRTGVAPGETSYTTSEDDTEVERYPDGSWWGGPWSAPDLRPGESGPWQVRRGFWAIEGLRVEEKTTGRSMHLALETPFVTWFVRRPFILPSDQVVFELGAQICLFDPATRKIAMIARGRDLIASPGDPAAHGPPPPAPRPRDADPDPDQIPNPGR
ncbi:MAG: hypothetical protein JXP34_21705 [Planctomycetes bacterium]|nr:hypothetical protein [Planctomycetota bacterium]